MGVVKAAFTSSNWYVSEWCTYAIKGVFTAQCVKVWSVTTQLSITTRGLLQLPLECVWGWNESISTVVN